jgi:glutathione S-transferase
MTAVALYGLTRSVYTRIARLALEEKGVAYALHEVEIFGPEGVPAEHRERHPFGRIPVLVHEDFTLYETAAITRYVDEAFPGPSLQPTAVDRRARSNQIVGLLDSYAYLPMVWGVFVRRVLNGESPQAPEVAAALGASARCLDALERLVTPRPYLLGTELCLADLHAWPMLRCLSLAPEGGEMLSKHDSLGAWMQAMTSRGSVSRTRDPFG